MTGKNGTSAEDENTARGDDSAWVQQFNVGALLLAFSGCVGALLIRGWIPRYPLSLVAALALGAVSAGVLLRQAGYPDPHRMSGARFRPVMVVALLGPALVLDLVLIVLLPGATVDRLAAFLLICSAAFAGLALVTVEAALEYVIAGLVGLMLANAFRLAAEPAGFADYAVSWLAYFLPLATTLVVLPRILRKAPSGLLGSGVLAILWPVVGQQDWGGKAVSFWSAPTWIVLGVLVALRLVLGWLPVPQRSKLGYLVAASLIATGLLVQLAR